MFIKRVRGYLCTLSLKYIIYCVKIGCNFLKMFRNILLVSGQGGWRTLKTLNLKKFQNKPWKWPQFGQKPWKWLSGPEKPSISTFLKGTYRKKIACGGPKLITKTVEKPWKSQTGLENHEILFKKKKDNAEKNWKIFGGPENPWKSVSKNLKPLKNCGKPD